MRRAVDAKLDWPRLASYWFADNLLTCECWTHVEYKIIGASVARSDLARVFAAHALNRENSLTYNMETCVYMSEHRNPVQLRGSGTLNSPCTQLSAHRSTCADSHTKTLTNNSFEYIYIYNYISMNTQSMIVIDSLHLMITYIYCTFNVLSGAGRQQYSSNMNRIAVHNHTASRSSAVLFHFLRGVASIPSNAWWKVREVLGISTKMASWRVCSHCRDTCNEYICRASRARANLKSYP